MSVEQVIALVSALSLAILDPRAVDHRDGPDRAFAHGRERALPYALGLAFGASLVVHLCAGGACGALQARHPALYVGFKIFGGLYLLWFALGLWAPRPSRCRRRRPGPRGSLAVSHSIFRTRSPRCFTPP